MKGMENKLYDNIRGAFIEAVNKLNADPLVTVTDLYVCVKYDELLLTIYDDTENILLQVTLDEWNELKEEQEDFNEIVIATLKKALNTDMMRQQFESLDLIAPFSVILVDEDLEQIAEIITIDKDVMFLDDDFFKNLDKDLDDFFEKLMADEK